MDYVREPKMIKNSFFQRSIIAFIGNNQLHNPSKLPKIGKLMGLTFPKRKKMMAVYMI